MCYEKHTKHLTLLKETRDSMANAVFGQSVGIVALQRTATKAILCG
jgi:hypothetical protein